MVDEGVESDSMSQEHWKAGIEDFNQGRFWHAHESWEKGWNRLPPPLKDYIQALIMACGMFVHLEKSKAGPARALRLRSLELFEASREIDRHARIEIPGLEELLREAESSPNSSGEELLSRGKKLRAHFILN